VVTSLFGGFGGFRHDREESVKAYMRWRFSGGFVGIGYG
jgi:hypothetical protein